MRRAEGIRDAGVTVPAPFVISFEGLRLTVDGGKGNGGRSVPYDVFGAVSDLMLTLGAQTQPGPVTVEVHRFSVHGHSLGDYGSMVCAFPGSEASAAYRCYSRGLGLLTDGRVRLVTHDTFPGGHCPEPSLLQGSVETPQQAHGLLTRFRALISGLPAREARLSELVFAELAANTLRHGRQGQMAVYRYNGGLAILAKDQGPGIPLHALPSSLLVKGYSTATGSLGAGYPMVIRLAKTLTIATSDQGTSILVRLTSTPSEVK